METLRDVFIMDKLRYNPVFSNDYYLKNVEKYSWKMLLINVIIRVVEMFRLLYRLSRGKNFISRIISIREKHYLLCSIVYPISSDNYFLNNVEKHILGVRLEILLKNNNFYTANCSLLDRDYLEKEILFEFYFKNNF